MRRTLGLSWALNAAGADTPACVAGTPSEVGDEVAIGCSARAAGDGPASVGLASPQAAASPAPKTRSTIRATHGRRPNPLTQDMPRIPLPVKSDLSTIIATSCGNGAQL